MSYIASWSGGKDSCLACYNAVLNGYDIRYLVNLVSAEYGRVSFHGTEPRLIQLQVESIGRRVDRDFIEYLKNKNVCPCGEKGEYHTLVIDGPIFDKAIEIIEARTIARDKYRFLDTLKYRLARSREQWPTRFEVKG